MQLHDIRARMPRPLRATYRYACAAVPYAWRHGGAVYRRTLRGLRESERWPRAALLELQCRELQRLVRHAAEHVPYYRAQFAALGLDPADVRAPDDLARLPFLDRATTAANLERLLADNIPRRRRLYQTTGGTSGRPMPLYADRRVSLQRDRAFWDLCLERAGCRVGARLVVLRNDVLPGGRLWDYNPRTRLLSLDPFKLTPATVRQYADAVIRAGIPFLHTYPSSACMFLTLLRDAGETRRLPFRAILASSENIYPGQRAFLEEGFGARLFSWYGHSERLVLACECERSPDYHVFPEYGVLELVDAQGLTIREPGVRGELVGTGFNNDVMPLLRYRTGDYAEYAREQACPCGREHPLITAVAGRWLQEMIVRPDGGLVSMTALNLHSDAFDNVWQFQFRQAERGQLDLRVVAKPEYTEADAARIESELRPKLGPDLALHIERVSEIARTPAGKHRFLIQELAIARPGAGASAGNA